MSMKCKPYTAHTLSGAQAEVRAVRKTLERVQNLLERYAEKRNLLARLAAKTPQFSNPLHAWEAERIRDEILAGKR